MAMNSKQILFAANWKLNKNPRQTREFFQEFRAVHPQEQWGKSVFFVPSTNLEAAVQATEGTGIGIGSQNCFSQKSGAFTGETSAEVVRDIGAQYVLLGHSERRQYFGETDESVAAKGKLVQDLGLIPMLCIGETLSEREGGLTEKVCETQLVAFMKTIDLSKKWVIAYEPVWAIGTGKVASLEQVAETHSFIRRLIAREGGDAATLILYGGSVKPDNATDLLKIPDVNGFLVGGASLEVSSFSKICLS